MKFIKSLSKSYNELQEDAQQADLEPQNSDHVHEKFDWSRFSCSPHSFLFAWISLAISGARTSLGPFGAYHRSPISPTLFPVVSLSGVGPVFKYLYSQGVPPLLAVVWRQENVLFFLMPLFLVEFFRATPAQRRTWVSKEALWTLWWSSFCWTANLILWVIALKYTSALRAALFGSISPIVVSVQMKIKGVSLMWGELAGVVLTTLGIVICAGSGLWGPSQGPMELVGDFMCSLASAIWAFYLHFSGRCRKIMPVSTFSTLASFLMTLLTLFASVAAEGTTWDQVVGWTAPKFLWIVLLFGFVTGVVGLIGMNWSLKYLTTIVTSITFLLEPLFTGLFAWALGVDSVPDASTFIGGFFVLCGVGSASYGDQKRKKEAAAKQGSQTMEEELKDIALNDAIKTPTHDPLDAPSS